ncbi:MAG: two-component regulator propeller domain-containing protein [Flavobacteriales bacterium]
MKTHTLLLAALLALLSACKENRSIGQAEVELGKELWYVFQDTKNNYWFSSNGQGVYRYDGNRVVRFTTSDGLANDTTRHIQEDGQGNIFISTFGGISKFDGEAFTTLQPVESTEWKSAPGVLWFHVLGASTSGAYRYDGTTLYHLEFPRHYLHDELYPRVAGSFFSPYEVYTIYKDRKGAIWFGTSVFGACRFDGETVKWMYEEDLTYVPAGGTFGIRSIFEDKEGSFWLCHTGHRYRFDFEKTRVSVRLEYKKTEGIGDERVFGGDPAIYFSHIVEDNSGNLWLTTWSQGVYKYDGQTITHYPVTDGSDTVNLVSMYKDNHGTLWLGTAQHGVYRFNGVTFEKFIP